ncbi:hypothetical protein QO010_001182 [Caulobacter ginsengisoli]|uniref:HEAT repeat domain-containing protein n=1 Tax=Caulobacter ginsengisoli TaxID=400775 RepID=A0ABU0IPU9_9CAUL|nr:hypothetical protein [Caulobacter ginsengisoli]MDQ0463411.1 hypothetical protein [Caulobacter ginsengisoli]
MIASADDFAALAKDPTRQFQALTDTAPEAVWLEVLERFPELKAEVAQNSSITEAVVRRLAADRDPALRLMMARRPSLPDDVFEALSRDPNPEVRRAIAWNSRAPAAIRERLAGDPDPGVASRARQVIETLKAAADRQIAMPSIPGLDPDRSQPDQAAVTARADTTVEAFRALLDWLPPSLGLHFYDADHPSPSDPGAYVTVQKTAKGLAWTMGNHGWSGPWRPVAVEAVVERLLANRLTPEGKPARLTIEPAVSMQERRVIARRRKGGWVLAIIILGVLAWVGLTIAMNIGFDYRLPW